jgi:ABC-type branched-subunit amino acid transport system substrate-binding protein
MFLEHGIFAFRPGWSVIRRFSRFWSLRLSSTSRHTPFDGWKLAKAVEMAKSTEPDAIVAALEKIEYDGVLGTIYFSREREPDYMFHQWPGAKAVLIQYTEKDQKYTDAELLWPALLKP